MNTNFQGTYISCISIYWLGLSICEQRWDSQNLHHLVLISWLHPFYSQAILYVYSFKSTPSLIPYSGYLLQVLILQIIKASIFS